jgi:hypothetical protein
VSAIAAAPLRGARKKKTDLAHPSSPQSFTTFILLEAVVAYRVLSSMTWARSWLLPVMFVVAELGTDFVSGLSHWMCDTWGRLDTPVVGPTFIRSFREHHVDPTAMCHHDFIETNSDASLFSVLLNGCLLGLYGFDGSSMVDMVIYSFALFGGFYAAFTNEFHKWSHMSVTPPWISLLQSWWVVLPKRHHGVHHKPPFDKYYCITTGHLNSFLDGIGFWRRLEAVISAVTGVQPREDDKRWTQQLYGAATGPLPPTHSS